MKLPDPHSDVQETLLALILNRSLTSIQLRRITKSSFPPARIADCKKAGIDLAITSEKYVNRRGKVSVISRYTLENINQARKIYKKLVA